ACATVRRGQGLLGATAGATEPGGACPRRPSVCPGLTDPAPIRPGGACRRPPSVCPELTDPISTAAPTISWIRVIEVKPRRTIDSVQPSAIVGQVRYAR